MKFWPKKKALTPEKLWEWFVANEERIRTAEPMNAFNMVSDKIKEVEPDLAIGIVVRDDGKPCMLEITPNGDFKLAKIAVELAAILASGILHHRSSCSMACRRIVTGFACIWIFPTILIRESSNIWGF